MIDTGLGALAVTIVDVVLACVFVIAAIAKIRDPLGTAQMLRGFGVPLRLTPAATRSLPLSEVIVAALLLIPRWPRTGAALAVLLLTLFTVAMIVNLALGRRVQCRCFGQATPQDIGPATVGRNALLLCLGVFVFVGAGPGTEVSAFLWIRENAAAFATAAVGTAAYAALTFLLFQILRQQGRILLRLEALEAGSNVRNAPSVAAQTGLPIGSKAPTFVLSTLAGREHALIDPAGQRSQLVLFVHPGCGPCHVLLQGLPKWRQLFANDVAIAIVTEGTIEENRTVFSDMAHDLVLVQHDRDASEAYQVYGTPAAVLVDRNGDIASYPAMGADAISELIGSIRSSSLVASVASATLDETRIAAARS